ncbi:hypothetical protein LB521_26760 [Mesorhizobium sp. BR-1-1-8]|uniref:hypothetical protein n=1 Tax=Mesorhizobium sp. BR-1-1-8 TaxID=2876659 RepID=UPI001CCC58D7|nr:hypothetical protein [Mesorhizobium sp. BR-1-1-8]MBZ9984736.1 hypothetical protein [Mesorhizobium sp. BR-1-1-8]
MNSNTAEPVTSWQFKIGQCISHKDQSMPSLVVGRVLTSKGKEVYGVRSFATVDPNRDRMVMGASLVDVVPGTGPCHDCLLYMTGICPGALASA